MKSKKQFHPQINVVKAVASISVTAVHFRNRIETGIPEVQITNKITLFFSANYALFIFAVPLFLLATGFLSIHKTNDFKHFFNIIKVYFLYIFLALISYGMMIFTNSWDFIGWKEMIVNAMSFSLISGWYIELYIGLALFIPFLNLLINKLTKKEFQSLILTLLVAVSIPAFINKSPDFPNVYLPNYWQSIYPIIYYFIGAYIRLYYEEIKISNRWLFFMYSTSVLFIVQLLYRNASPYTKSFEGYYASIINVVLATSFFLLLFRKVHNSHFVFNTISKYTLSTYIMAYPVDKFLYPRFIQLFSSNRTLLLASPIIVIISFITTLISGIILYKIFDFIWTISIKPLQKYLRMKDLKF